MLSLTAIGKAPLRVLCVGCHSDDIEIGCGGTILQLQSHHADLDVTWVVLSSGGTEREQEARKSASLFLGPTKKQDLVVKQFRDSFFPFEGAEIKGIFERELKTRTPDLVFTHYGQDAHQDHRLVSELTWNTFRDQMILEYEIPKYDGDLGKPNFFVPLDKEIYENKVRFLMQAFHSQHRKRWFEPQTFLALMRLRGMECNAPSGYAEGFHARKLVW